MVNRKRLDDISRRRQKKFTYTLGPDVNVLADHADSDILVFVKGESLKKTCGEIARELFMRIMVGTSFLPSETRITMGIVDGNTGDLLWYHYNTDLGIDPAKDDQVRKSIHAMLKPFPVSSEKQARWLEKGIVG